MKGGPQGASDTAHEKPQVLRETNGDIHLKVAEKIIMNNKIEDTKMNPLVSHVQFECFTCANLH